MIFYKSIKYKIFEFCIDKLVTSVSNNLSDRPQIFVHDIVEGMVLSRVQIDNIYWENCVIRNIFDSNGLKTIRFKYSSSSRIDSPEHIKVQTVIVMESGLYFKKVDFYL